MTHKEMTSMVERAIELHCDIEEHFRDISDIDFLIDSLKQKRKTIARRMRKDCDSLAAIMRNEKEFLNGVTDDFIQTINESIEFVEEFSKQYSKG